MSHCGSLCVHLRLNGAFGIFRLISDIKFGKFSTIIFSNILCLLTILSPFFLSHSIHVGLLYVVLHVPSAVFTLLWYFLFLFLRLKNVHWKTNISLVWLCDNHCVGCLICHRSWYSQQSWVKYFLLQLEIKQQRFREFNFIKATQQLARLGQSPGWLMAKLMLLGS